MTDPEHPPGPRVWPGWAPPSPRPRRDWEPRAVASLAMGGAALLLFLVVLPAFLLGISALVAGASALLRLRNRPDRPGRLIAGDARYPGTAALRQFADEHCRQAFARFVDLPAEQAGLVAGDLVPTEDVWRRGSRHVVCAVARPDGRRITGSVADNSTDLPPPA